MAGRADIYSDIFLVRERTFNAIFVDGSNAEIIKRVAEIGQAFDGGAGGGEEGGWVNGGSAVNV